MRCTFRGEVIKTDSATPVPELVKALREIQKSIPRWSRHGGRKGYLDFVNQYLPQIVSTTSVAVHRRNSSEFPPDTLASAWPLRLPALRPASA